MSVATYGPATSFGTSYGGCGPSASDLYPIYAPQSGDGYHPTFDQIISTIKDCKTDLERMSDAEYEGAKAGVREAYRKTFYGSLPSLSTGRPRQYDWQTKSEWEETFTELGKLFKYSPGDMGSEMSKDVIDLAFNELFSTSPSGKHETPNGDFASSAPISALDSGYREIVAPSILDEWSRPNDSTIQVISRPGSYRGYDRGSRITQSQERFKERFSRYPSFSAPISTIQPTVGSLGPSLLNTIPHSAMYSGLHPSLHNTYSASPYSQALSSNFTQVPTNPLWSYSPSSIASLNSLPSHLPPRTNGLSGDYNGSLSPTFALSSSPNTSSGYSYPQPSYRSFVSSRPTASTIIDSE